MLHPRATDPGQRLAFGGTVRARSPEATWAIIEGYCARAGITRVADVTGLDRIGLPVFNVVRPLSKSVAIATGKGVTTIGARVSGTMEAIEGHCAENIDLSVIRGSVGQLSAAGHRLLDLQRAARTAGRMPDARTELAWVTGFCLMAQAPVLVPLELVTNDFTLPDDASFGFFQRSTNGLASGNTILEAITHAIYEVVERDALAQFHYLFDVGAGFRRVNPASMSETLATLTGRIEAAGMEVFAWDASSDVGLSSAYAVIWEPLAAQTSSLRATSGSGAHADPAIALSRAITEAAQDRLTLISGARDDLEPGHYVIQPEAAAAMRDGLRLDEPTPTTPDLTCGDWPSDPQAPTYAAEIERILDALRGIGIEQAVCVDLSRADMPDIAVVKMVIPGLEPPHDDPGYVSGPRLHAAAARRAAIVPEGQPCERAASASASAPVSA